MPNSVYPGDHSEKLEEKGFSLPLPTLVEGIDSKGNPFEEKTTLTYISAVGSSFWLKTEVNLNTQLRLTVDLPPKLADKDNLKLVIKGKIIFKEESGPKKSKTRVSLKFENRYIIEPKD